MLQERMLSRSKDDLIGNSGHVLARANAFAVIERRLTFPEAKVNGRSLLCR